MKRLLSGTAWTFLLALPGVAASSAAFAQSNFPPEGPITIIVPAPPGGNSDNTSRLLAEKLSLEWKRPVVVENRPSAGGVTAYTAVARSKGDGRTLAYASSSLTINPGLMKRLPFDTTKDITGVSQLTSQPLAIVAAADAPFNTLKEMFEYAKAHPDNMTYGTPGIGTVMQMAGELLNQRVGVKMLHVPYKGSSPAQLDLIGKRITIAIDTLAFQQPAISAGKVKLIAITSPKRHERFPQYPTVAETVPGFSAGSNAGIVAAGSTPPDLVAKISESIAKVLREPATKKRLEDGGLDVVASTPGDFNQQIQREIVTWGQVITKANISID